MTHGIFIKFGGTWELAARVIPQSKHNFISASFVHNFNEHCPLSDEELVEHNKQAKEAFGKYFFRRRTPTTEQDWWESLNQDVPEIPNREELKWYVFAEHFRYRYSRFIRCRDGKYRFCPAYRFRLTYKRQIFSLICYLDPTMIWMDTPILGKDFYRQLNKTDQLSLRLHDEDVRMFRGRKDNNYD